MKNIYVKKNIIGRGYKVWYTTKDHKFNPGDFVRIIHGKKVLGRYIVKCEKTLYPCEKCSLGDFMGTDCCVLKRESGSGGYSHLCTNMDLAKEGKLITFIDIMNVLEGL